MLQRKLTRNFSTPSVAATSGQLVGPNPRRWALIVSCDATDDVTLSFGKAAVLHKGINLFKGGPPFVLLYDHVGQAIREEINAISATGAAVIGVVDIMEIDCGCSDAEGVNPLSYTGRGKY